MRSPGKESDDYHWKDDSSLLDATMFHQSMKSRLQPLNNAGLDFILSVVRYDTLVSIAKLVVLTCLPLKFNATFSLYFHMVFFFDALFTASICYDRSTPIPVRDNV